MRAARVTGSAEVVPPEMVEFYWDVIARAVHDLEDGRPGQENFDSALGLFEEPEMLGFFVGVCRLLERPPLRLFAYVEELCERQGFCSLPATRAALKLVRECPR